MREIDPDKEQIVKQYEAGKYLKKLRGDLSLAKVCKDIDVSANYLSDVERGRLPSDRFISMIADYYKIDEDDLYIRFGKVPLLAKEEVYGNDTLQRTLAEIGRNKKLSDTDKERLYDSIYRTYTMFIKHLECNKDK